MDHYFLAAIKCLNHNIINIIGAILYNRNAFRCWVRVTGIKHFIIDRSLFIHANDNLTLPLLLKI